VVYVADRPRRYRSVGTVYEHGAWGMKNGKNRDDGLVMFYAVVWDNYAHKEDAHHTSVPEYNLKLLPAVERLAEIINAPPTYTA
jgi:hypothetical protein